MSQEAMVELPHSLFISSVSNVHHFTLTVNLSIEAISYVQTWREKVIGTAFVASFSCFTVDGTWDTISSGPETDISPQ